MPESKVLAAAVVDEVFDLVPAPKKKPRNPTAKNAKIEKAFNRLQAIAAECKTLYGEADGHEMAIIRAIEAAGGKLPISGGRTLSLKDNFLDRNGEPRNKAFKTTAVSRWEIVCL